MKLLGLFRDSDLWLVRFSATLTFWWSMPHTHSDACYVHKPWFIKGIGLIHGPPAFFLHNLTLARNIHVFDKGRPPNLTTPLNGRLYRQLKCLHRQEDCAWAPAKRSTCRHSRETGLPSSWQNKLLTKSKLLNVLIFLSL